MLLAVLLIDVAGSAAVLACLSYTRFIGRQEDEKRLRNQHIAIDRTLGGKDMGLPNRDEVEGKFDQAKGKAKEAVGRAIDDREMENEGAAEHTGGKVQEGFGKAR